MEVLAPWIHGMLKNISWVLLGILAAALLFVYTQQAQTTKAIQDCIKQYSLTSQTLDCVTYQESADTLHSLDAALDQQTALYIQEGKATRVSIFVRDLETKQWASTNENQTYDPASLIKLPLMIAYYKAADVDPSTLTTQLMYTVSTSTGDTMQDFLSQANLVPGQMYSVEQLIEAMIIDSDNNAAGVLQAHLYPGIFQNTLIDFGITIPRSNNTYDFVTAKTYSNIFRMLYNASYLTRNYSQKALDLLASSTFKALAKPLPSSVVVADKFGEREFDDANGNPVSRQLHDCGIVYKDTRPYSICIMTEGANFGDLQSISKRFLTWRIKNYKRGRSLHIAIAP